MTETQGTLTLLAKGFNERRAALSISISEGAQEKQIVLGASGELDSGVARDFASICIQTLDYIGENGNLVLDLSGITYISSTCIGSLTLILGEASKRGLGLRLEGLSGRIRNIFDVLGVSNFFNFGGGMERP